MKYLLFIFFITAIIFSNKVYGSTPSPTPTPQLNYDQRQQLRIYGSYIGERVPYGYGSVDLVCAPNITTLKNWGILEPNFIVPNGSPYGNFNALASLPGAIVYTQSTVINCPNKKVTVAQVLAWYPECKAEANFSCNYILPSPTPEPHCHK